jgi:hypothetical protein
MSCHSEHLLWLSATVAEEDVCIAFRHSFQPFSEGIVDDLSVPKTVMRKGVSSAERASVQLENLYMRSMVSGSSRRNIFPGTSRRT